jgi:hypothetical protein
MAQDKKSFVLYSDLLSTVSKLVEQDKKHQTNHAGELFLTILEYVNDKDPTPENFIVEMSFEPIKIQLKRDLEKWENQLEQRRQAGKRSAEVRSNKSNDRSTTVQRPLTSVDESQRAPTDNVNVNVSDNVNVIKEDNTNGEIEFADVVIPAPKEKRSFNKPTIEQIKEHCLSRKNNIDAEAFFNYYESVGWKVGRNQMKSWQSAIITWEKRNKENNGKSTISKADNLHQALDRF